MGIGHCIEHSKQLRVAGEWMQFNGSFDMIGRCMGRVISAVPNHSQQTAPHTLHHVTMPNAVQCSTLSSWLIYSTWSDHSHSSLCPEQHSSPLLFRTRNMLNCKTLTYFNTRRIVVRTYAGQHVKVHIYPEGNWMKWHNVFPQTSMLQCVINIENVPVCILIFQ